MQSDYKNPDFSRKSILIIEDDEFSLEYLKEVLSETKVRLLLAKNGYEAINIVEREPNIDLILLDIQLPDISGERVVGAIRMININVPVIAQTAHAMVGDKLRYFEAGCNDYISKPIDADELIFLLSKYLT